MKSEQMKILEMLQNGTITAVEAAELLKAIGETKEKEVKSTVISSLGNPIIFDTKGKKALKRKMLRVKIDSADGDKVNIAVPIELVKTLKSFNIDGKFKAANIENIDVESIIELIENGADGEIVNIKSADGDTVLIYVD